MSGNGKASRRETLLAFPCEFPIKAFGPRTDHFERTVLDIFRRHVPDLAEDRVHHQPSRRGRYVSITVTVTATSQEQLDSIYRDLSASEQVLMAL